MQGDIRPTHSLKPMPRPKAFHGPAERHIPRVERSQPRRIDDVMMPQPLRPQASRRAVPKLQIITAKTVRQAVPAVVQPVKKPQDVVVDTTQHQQAEEAEQPKRTSRKHHFKRPKPHTVMYAAAMFLFVVGLGVVVEGTLLNNQVKEQAHVLSAKSDSPESAAESSEAAAVPSEEKPKGNYLATYKVAADLPRLLTIPALGVKSRVLQVGVDLKNELLTPKNIYDTAWYTGSGKPGELGAMVIDGHYSGPTTNGVFSKLSRLTPGSVIGVERGDGTVFTYEVRSVENKKEAEVDMAKLMVSADTSRPGLNLITCAGKYDTKTNQFSERTIVYAVQK